MILAHAAGRLRAHARAVGVRAGVLGYRPPYSFDGAVWDGEYARGALDFYRDVSEAPRYGILAAYLGAISPRSIVDIGCGVGILRQRIDHLRFEQYVGLDVSPVAIEEARAAADGRSTFLVGERPGPELGRFDVAVCNEVLYYVDRPDDLLAVLRDAIVPGGHLLTSIWRHPGDAVLHRMVEARFDFVDGVSLASLSQVGRRWRVALHRVRPT